MKILYLDLLPAYIPFEVQSTDGTGAVLDPTGTPTVSIYEEGGADGTFDNSGIAGSPFTLAKINAKTGNYGILVAKSALTAGKIYRCLYELTVDGIATAKEENYLALNSASFKADVSNLDVAVSTRAPSSEYDTEMGRIDVDLSTRSSHTAANVWTTGSRELSTPNSYKADVSAVATELNATANKDEVIVEVDANETKIDTAITDIGTVDGKVDTVDTNVDSIKVKTDNIPTDPTSEAIATTNKDEVIASIGTSGENFNMTTGDE